MTVDDYLESAREAFLALDNGRAQSPMPLYLPADGGGIHAKGALLRTASGVYATLNVDVGNVTSFTVTGLAPGNVYYFAVTAYDTGGFESGVSNEVSAAK